MELNLTSCDREPINTPGAIQDFGALIVLNPSNREIVQVSENAERIIGLKPEELLGRYADEVFGPLCRKALDTSARMFRTETLTAFLWKTADALLIEVEPNGPMAETRLEMKALDRLQSAESLQDLLETAAQSVADLTGLDRVMIYRFHDDLHGEVVAEAIRPGVPSYLGLHYPATDIPLPARAVFLKNWVRMIPDIESRTVALRPAENPLTRAPLDLGISLLRAVSPIHIEYLKNMGVGATLTISLVTNGKLWGLIACHSLDKKYIEPNVREACETIGRMTSAFITVKDGLDFHRARDRYLAIYRRLKERLRHANDMAAELVKESPNLLDLIATSGSSVALFLDGRWVNLGDTPSEPELNALSDWLAANHPDVPLFATDELGKDYPPALNFSVSAAGLLALGIPKTTQNYVLWFRPERIRTVKWAGSPLKAPDQTGRLNPRQSFEEWKEKVTGRSEPWSEVEKEAALELRSGILAVDLQRQFVKEQAARADAVRAMHAREELMAVLSHDLKNPLGSIRLNTKVATKFLEPGKIERVKEYLERIDRATSSMNALIDDVLSITKLESGHLEVEKSVQDIPSILQEVIELLNPLAAVKGIMLEYEVKTQNFEAKCDRSRIIQVLSNIIGNAIKFAPENGMISSTIESAGPEFLRIGVQDNGPGIKPENLKNIFDRFWQAQHTRRLGTGLGLAIAKGIIEAHGGEVWADSDGKTGSTFFVTLPVYVERVLL